MHRQWRASTNKNKNEAKIKELEEQIVKYKNTILDLKTANSKLQLKVNATENPDAIRVSLKKYKKKNKVLDQKAEALKGKIKKRKAKIVELKQIHTRVL